MSLLAIRRLDDGEDGALYPVPGVGPNEIVFEPSDGSDIKQLVATSIHLQEWVGDKKDTLLRASEIKAMVFITDARVAIACSKYDKGGGWSGTGVVSGVTSLAFNTVSWTAAAVRRKGKMLVGQVRYPWLESIGFITKTSWLYNEELRLITNVRRGGQKCDLVLDLVLPKGTDTAAVAQTICQRAASYRLSSGEDHSTDEAAMFAQLAQTERLQPIPKQYVFHEMPTSWNVSEGTAYGPSSSGSYSSMVETPSGLIPYSSGSTGDAPEVDLVETPAGWYADPAGEAELRWWDGAAWTSATHYPVSSTGVASEGGQGTGG